MFFHIRIFSLPLVHFQHSVWPVIFSVHSLLLRFADYTRGRRQIYKRVFLASCFKRLSHIKRENGAVVECVAAGIRLSECECTCPTCQLGSLAWATKFSVPWFPHLYNGHNCNAYLETLKGPIPSRLAATQHSLVCYSFFPLYSLLKGYFLDGSHSVFFVLSPSNFPKEENNKFRYVPCSNYYVRYCSKQFTWTNPFTYTTL